MRAWQILLSLCAVMLSFAGEPVRATPHATLTVTMSNPTCVQASANSGACYIIIRSVSASASDQSFTNLDISIDGKVRARIQPFFETTVNVSNRMFGHGLLVTCGRPNDSGDPAYGRRYQVAYNGYLAGNSTPAASGTALVYCPYYDGKLYLPLIRK